MNRATFTNRSWTSLLKPRQHTVACLVTSYNGQPALVHWQRNWNREDRALPRRKTSRNLERAPSGVIYRPLLRGLIWKCSVFYILRSQSASQLRFPRHVLGYMQQFEDGAQRHPLGSMTNFSSPLRWTLLLDFRRHWMITSYHWQLLDLTFITPTDALNEENSLFTSIGLQCLS